MIVISSIGCLNGDYNVLNDEELVAIGVDWNTGIELVSELAPIVWTTKRAIEDENYNIDNPILKQGKLYGEQLGGYAISIYVCNFNKQTQSIDIDDNSRSYVIKQGFDYFFNYEDALAKYKEQIENKLGELYTELNYWNKVKSSLN